MKSACPEQGSLGLLVGGGRAVEPSVLSLLAGMDGVACVARDESLAVFWCNSAYERICKAPAAAVIGTRLGDLIPPSAATEREALYRRVIETGVAESFYQLGIGQRLLCSAHPLDDVSFGHRGVLAMTQPASNGGTLAASEDSLLVLSTPCLDELSVLSPAELRVLHYLSTGMATADIGEKLCRSAKTIEKQIESLHRKLGTRSRAELVRFASERGLQSFADDAWESIIRGASLVRREPQTRRVGTGV